MSGKTTLPPAAAVSQVTRLLRDASGGDRTAEERLVQLLYDDLHRMARRHMRGERLEHTLQPTALLNEAFVRLLRGTANTWQDRMHFLAAASTVMRRILVDHARRRAAAKRGQPAAGVELEDLADSGSPHTPEELIAIDAALVALAGVDERQARIVELRFFTGLGNDEIAALLDVSPRTVKRDWTAAKAWLYQRLGPRG